MANRNVSTVSDVVLLPKRIEMTVTVNRYVSTLAFVDMWLERTEAYRLLLLLLKRTEMTAMSHRNVRSVIVASFIDLIQCCDKNQLLPA
uniref:Uncharacterized protein n=1 Tax=Ditylenchus dipsaci TaxID=166011 RepID=A0A915DH70_9BILA